jgi:sulfur relay (sulfurtransferase) complex TusBCD TusD component (DsrE family)
MRILFILNDAPYGSEKAYNALRMAMTLQKEHPDVEIRIFSDGGRGHVCFAHPNNTARIL